MGALVINIGRYDSDRDTGGLNMKRMRLVAAAAMASFAGLLGMPLRTPSYGNARSSKRKQLDARYSEAWHGGQLQAKNGQPCNPPNGLDTHSRNRWMQGWTAKKEQVRQ